MPARNLSRTRQNRKPAESPRDATLRILKIRGAITVIELTRLLKLTETAVRRHLLKLQLGGLITCTMKSRTKGRPTNVYSLTDKATSEYFPTGFEELAARMLDTLFAAEGHRGVFNFLLMANQHQSSARIAGLLDKRLKERVQAISESFKQNGYMTDFRELPQGKFFLYHQNCAIYALATKYRQLCFMELKLIQALAGTKVTRQQYIFKGQPICGYLIEPSAGAVQPLNDQVKSQ